MGASEDCDNTTSAEIDSCRFGGALFAAWAIGGGVRNMYKSDNFFKCKLRISFILVIILIVHISSIQALKSVAIK